MSVNPQEYRGIVEKARNVFKYAIKVGKLTKPDRCSECGGRTNILQAHHDDYRKPCEVRWLCRSCHGVVHVGKHGSHQFLGDDSQSIVTQLY